MIDGKRSLRWICAVIFIVGCADFGPKSERRQDDQTEILRTVLMHQIGFYETLQRRGSGLPTIAFIGLVGPGGAEPITDADASLIRELHSDIFVIRSVSSSEIRDSGP